ncbi:MAG: hypothetical protein DMG62_21855 [Acidobacteria bacterium]|nr:MAG: hypothetical protein DMG62_21855 [Acidobacteriota bacterium]
MDWIGNNQKDLFNKLRDFFDKDAKYSNYTLLKLGMLYNICCHFKGYNKIINKIYFSYQKVVEVSNCYFKNNIDNKLITVCE